MAKYEPLKTFLTGRHEGEIPMTFHEIEALIGATLPPAAFKHRAWWSNNRSNSVITHAWLDAGFKTETVDMGSQKLVFRRADGTPAPRHARPRWLELLRAKMAGTVHVQQGWDLTNPTGEVWDAEHE